jgi:ABC-type uncharacterized transport system substrate-binding protein
MRAPLPLRTGAFGAKVRLAAFTVGLALLVAAPFTSEAQQVGKVYRLGVLERVSPALNAANFDAFRQGLRELGYLEGQNLTIEYRSAEGRSDRFPSLAAELVSMNVDVIVTGGRRPPWRRRRRQERSRS